MNETSIIKCDKSESEVSLLQRQITIDLVVKLVIESESATKTDNDWSRRQARHWMNETSFATCV